MDATITIALTSILIALTGGYLYKAVRIVNQDKEALVERLGRYEKVLKPGINFIVPLLDRVVFEQTTAEVQANPGAQSCITKDNVVISVDAVYYWRIEDLYKTRYNVQNVQQALDDVICGTIRDEIGKLNLDQASSSRTKISSAILAELDRATESWGVKVTRIEIQEILPPDRVTQAMEQEIAAEREKRAKILRSEGDRTAEINRAQGEAEAQAIRAKSDREVQLLQASAFSEAMERLAGALARGEDYRQAMQFLLAQGYLEMGKTVGQSPSAKVLFMDPKSLPGTLQALLSMVELSGSGAIEANPKHPYSAAGNLRPLEVPLKPPIDTTTLPIAPEGSPKPPAL